MQVDCRHLEAEIQIPNDSEMRSARFSLPILRIPSPSRQQSKNLKHLGSGLPLTGMRFQMFLLGKSVIDDAVLEVNKEKQQVKHIVYSSVGNATTAHENVEHFRSKGDVEDYMKEQLKDGITWSIVRPVAFFENLDDPKNWNPLKKGSVKFLGYADKKYKFVATQDIGKASAVFLMEPKKYAGKTIDAVGGEHTGKELAEALSEVSSVPCTYKTAVPRFMLWLLMKDLYYMMVWMEEVGYEADIDEFKKVVPEPMDAKAWFQSKGQWSDGEKF